LEFFRREVSRTGSYLLLPEPSQGNNGSVFHPILREALLSLREHLVIGSYSPKNPPEYSGSRG
jgi:hypothetical protein